jgi:hypothetical protein
MLDLNSTLVAIRERSIGDLLDLGLRVWKAMFWPLLVAGLIGILPCMGFNWWWLSKLPHEDFGDDRYYMIGLLLLSWWELPLATAPITVLLGQGMFQRKLDYRRAARELVQCAPQLIWYQSLRTLLMPHGLLFAYPRAMRDFSTLLVILAICWIYAVLRWSYLVEVILLEQNPWAARHGQLSTGQRSRALHAGDGGMIFGRALTLGLWEFKLMAITAISGWYVCGWLRNELFVDAWLYQLFLPAAFWFVSIYLTVVRFLCYLDLRIRREGWEVDLVLRAEAEHLLRPQMSAGGRTPDPTPVGV